VTFIAFKTLNKHTTILRLKDKNWAVVPKLGIYLRQAECVLFLPNKVNNKIIFTFIDGIDAAIIPIMHSK